MDKKIFSLIVLLTPFLVRAEKYPECLGDNTADSKICLSCHDGSLAKDVSNRGQQHPFGIDYPSNHSFYRDPSVIDKRILLPFEKIECISCHWVYATDQYKLVMPNDRSQLCLECHIK